ncbi:MAG: hypothetical protein ACXAE3_07335 [Candidatus Kariarchaeaceae archaeon]
MSTDKVTFLTALDLVSGAQVMVPGLLQPIDPLELHPNKLTSLPESARSQVMQRLEIIKREEQSPTARVVTKSRKYSSISRINQHEVIILDALLGYIKPLIPRTDDGTIVQTTSPKKVLLVTNGTRYKSGPMHETMALSDLRQISKRELLKRDLDISYLQYSAQRLYRGYHHRLMSAFRDRLSVHLYVDHRIISPGWGLLKPTDIVPNYDCTFAGRDDREIRLMTTITGLSSELQALISKGYDLIIFSLTPSFRDVLNHLYLDQVLKETTMVDIRYNHHDLGVTIKKFS